MKKSRSIEAELATANGLHRAGQLQNAEQAYRRILQQRADHPPTLHFLALLKFQQGALQDAARLIARAVAINPGAADSLALQAAILSGLGRHAEALSALDQVMRINPRDAATLLNRSVVLTALGRLDEAVRSLDEAIASQPNLVPALFSRGTLLAQMGRDAEALASLDKVVALAPTAADPLNNRGNVLMRLGRVEAALASYDRALALDPDHPDAMNNRGIALKTLGRFEEALVCFDRVLLRNPGNLNALNNRGNILMKFACLQEARASFERGLAIRPDDVDTLVNSSVALMGLTAFDAAMDRLNRAVALQPNHPNALFNRGMLYLKSGRHDRAIADFQRTLERDPQHPLALGKLARCLQVNCGWAELAEIEPRLRAAVRNDTALVDPFILLAMDSTAEEQLACARAWNRHHGNAVRAPLRGTLAVPVAGAADKIRVAYVSGDFRPHPISSLVAELLRRHDRSRFEVIGVSTWPAGESDMRRRIESSCDRFFDVARGSDRDIAELIRDQQIAIAVDLSGHTETARLGIFAHRPAPIQVSYLGYAGTLGADYIDYVLADRIALPFDQQSAYSEKIVHLPDCFFINDDTKPIAARKPSRAECELPEQGFVFCAFNGSYKLTAGIFEIWMRLLGEVDGSVLWLSPADAAVETHLRAEASLRGIDPKRLVFATKLPLLEDHLARHRLADLFLDTLPYNAHTTASEALWAGLPVLTCTGSGFAGRVATSMLHAVGLQELVTASLAEYETLALQLTRDATRLKSLRDRLDRNRLTHRLFDTEKSCRHIEAAYARMFELWRSGQGPRGFSLAE